MKVFVTDILDDCIFGLDCMKQFQIVVDLNKGVIGVGHSVVAGKLKYVKYAEVGGKVGTDGKRCVGVGEVGWDKEGDPTQEQSLRAGIRLAVKYNKALVIHCRGWG